MKTGIELIAKERQRQIVVEGYTSQHDSQHNVNEFISAACTYAAAADLYLWSDSFDSTSSWHKTNEPFYWNEIKRRWPWGKEYFKPTNTLRDLVKAGALIAAAIDRLQMENKD